MSAPRIPDRTEFAAVIETVAREATAYLDDIDTRPVLGPGIDAALGHFAGALPETGSGAPAALRELLDFGLDGAAATSGPNCFHFVMGGATPASLGADWIAAMLDQLAYTWVSSPLAVHLEKLSIDWLKDLFALPADFGGLMTTGATMSNFVGLAAARQWWGERHDVDVSEAGLYGLPAMPIITSGFVHAASVKVLGMLGTGRANIQRHATDAAGRADLAAMEQALKALNGAPAVLIANAGEVNAGEFDPIDGMADLAQRYKSWLHVDGAFGLFARVSPRTEALAAGAHRADSITVDGHKWLNVPYDCGFAFVRRPELLRRSFAYSADYLADFDTARPTYGVMGPEGSRRARSLMVWSTLRAYGRSGYRAIVENHLDLARLLADCVDAAPDLERLADVRLNIVCFRYNPGGLDAAALDALNDRLGDAIIRDGRVFAGTTRFEGKVALRPAISNWRTRPNDIRAFVAVVRELGSGLG